MYMYNMGLFKEVGLIIPPKNRIQIIRQIKVKSLNGYDAIRDKLDEGNTMTVHASAMQRQPVQETTKPKTKVNIGL